MNEEPPVGDSPYGPSRQCHALREVASLMTRLGLTAFGGPAAHVAMLEEEVVNRRKWLSHQQFLDFFSVSGMIPGPTSTELVIHLGMTRAGWPGLLVAGLCFITPAVLLTTLLAWGYVTFGALPAAEGLLLGIKPAVVAIVFQAVARLAKSVAKTVWLGPMAALIAGLYLIGVNEVALLLGSGLLGILLARPPKATTASLALPLLAQIGGTAAAGGAAASGPLGLFLYFLKLGSMLFGSGYVLLAFLRHGLGNELAPLTEQQLMDAIAAGQFTPGPLFSTAAFLGFLLGGWPGAAAASVGIFLPSFILVGATHGLVQRLRDAPWSAGFLDGLNAGSVGLMAGVLVQLAQAAMGPFWTWPILIAAGLLLLKTKVNPAWIVVGAGLIGIAANAVSG